MFNYFKLILISISFFAQYLPIYLNNGWSLSWSDEFDYQDSQLENKWVSDNKGYTSFVICGRYREIVEVHDGILELKAIKETRMDHKGVTNNWTAGSIWTKKEFRYGYYEARYKYAGATGTNNSFWLWSNNKSAHEAQGYKAFELDVNEGHYPSGINTNIHNWTDTFTNSNGDVDHPKNAQHFTFGGDGDSVAGYTHILPTAVTGSKVRFSSNNGNHFHIGEFRVYAPNTDGYPSDPLSNTADTDVAGLINHVRNVSTTIKTSGQLVVAGRNTDTENVVDTKVTGTDPSWIAQKNGEKWLELDFGGNKNIGAIQFTNGWYDNNSKKWQGLIVDYKIEYWNGTQWLEIASYNTIVTEDYAVDYHTYG